MCSVVAAAADNMTSPLQGAGHSLPEESSWPWLLSLAVELHCARWAGYAASHELYVPYMYNVRSHLYLNELICCLGMFSTGNIQGEYLCRCRLHAQVLSGQSRPIPQAGLYPK